MADIIATIIALLVILGTLGAVALFFIAYAVGAAITFFVRLPRYRSEHGIGELDAGSLLIDAAFWPFTIAILLVARL